MPCTLYHFEPHSLVANPLTRYLCWPMFLLPSGCIDTSDAIVMLEFLPDATLVNLVCSEGLIDSKGKGTRTGDTLAHHCGSSPCCYPSPEVARSCVGTFRYFRVSRQDRPLSGGTELPVVVACGDRRQPLQLG